MKNKIILGGIILLAFLITISAAFAVTLDTATLTPTTAYTNSTLELKAKCSTTAGTIIAYWETYKDSTLQTSGSTIVANATETLLATIVNGLTAKNQAWYGAVWCGDGTTNTTATNTTTITILNSAPVLSSATVRIGSYEDEHTHALSATDADTDTLTYLLTSTGDANVAVCSISGSTLKATRVTNSTGSTTCAVQVTDGSATDSKTFTINVNKVYKLKIDKIKISGDVDSESYDENDIDSTMEINEVIPGGEITIKITFENMYTDDEDVDIEDITAEGTIYDVEVGDGDEEDIDANEDGEIDKIRADDSESLELVFDIPAVIEEDTYSLEIEIEADDEEGIDYNFILEFDVEILKEEYDLFSKVSLSPDTVPCSGTAELEIDLINIGDKEIEDVDVKVINSALEIDLKQTVDHMDDNIDKADNTETLTFELNIPENAAAKNYPIKVSIQGEDDDGDDQADLRASHSITLTVTECSASSTTSTTSTTGTTSTTDNNEPEIDIIDTTETQTGTTSSTSTTVDVTDSIETPFTESDLFIVLMIIGIVAIIVLIIVFLILSLRR